jgi:hypothetical protein
LEDTASEAGPALRDGRQLIVEARGLLRKVDHTVTDLQSFVPKDGNSIEEKTEKLWEAAEDLARVADRLDRFSGRMEDEFEDMTREEVERMLRNFFQQEGITVNVGTVVGKPPYPPPPENGKEERNPPDQQSPKSPEK